MTKRIQVLLLAVATLSGSVGCGEASENRESSLLTTTTSSISVVSAKSSAEKLKERAAEFYLTSARRVSCATDLFSFSENLFAANEESRWQGEWNSSEDLRFQAYRNEVLNTAKVVADEIEQLATALRTYDWPRYLNIEKSIEEYVSFLTSFATSIQMLSDAQTYEEVEASEMFPYPSSDPVSSIRRVLDLDPINDDDEKCEDSPSHSIEEEQSPTTESGPNWVTPEIIDFFEAPYVQRVCDIFRDLPEKGATLEQAQAAYVELQSLIDSYGLYAQKAKNKPSSYIDIWLFAEMAYGDIEILLTKGYWGIRFRYNREDVLDTCAKFKFGPENSEFANSTMGT